MKCLLLCLCFILALCIANGDDDKLLEIESPLGKIRGSLMVSRLKRRIHSFRGVRYAEPPVGQQRFKQAIPVKPWNETFDASEEGPACPQPAIEHQSEDCLRLNVYTTQLPTADSAVKRPVIVYFHPGGFYGSSAQSFIVGPAYFMDQDIVLVTANYRLASLGFFSTGDSLAPGNLGLKDQVEALRWVQKNIASFGGDPDSVTIVGYSAGGWSVTLHMVSPMSKGLFHRAIAMSGSVTYQNPLPTDQKHLANKQAEILGCPTDTTGNMLICLNTKTAEEIGNSTRQFFEWHRDPILVWLPVVEPEVPSVERFLPDQPMNLIRQGKFHQVPLITGITKDEFGGRVIPAVEAARAGNNTIFDDINANWTRIVPIIALYERETARSASVSEELRQFYLKGKPAGLDNYHGLAEIWADGVIGFSVHRLAKMMAEFSSQPVYYYKFSYQGRYSHANWADNTTYGVVHHDDLLYLFNISFFPYFEENSPEIPTVERQTAMWAHFAKTGEPIPKDNKLFANTTWTKFTLNNNAYLGIGDELTMKTGLYAERMNLWEKLFPLNALL
ncbi:esterase FE4 [Diachasma alloeum]|uniref:esterase FE4 n=1 Tax=Diachasma alloeum TaxID=454923 RepID=UPI0007383493|nr:esterase FE4 [Diachasma alloeum]